MKFKNCTKCGINYPATTEYFPPSQRGKYGLHSWCRGCFNEDQYERKDRNRKASKKYEKAEPELPKVYIPNLNMKVGKKYSFIVDRQGKGTERRRFTGKVIQICDRHIVFKAKNYIESFLKVDLNNYKISEV